MSGAPRKGEGAAKAAPYAPLRFYQNETEEASAMEKSQNPYAAVIADLRTWRAEIDQAIEMMTRLGEKRAGGAIGVAPGGEAEIRSDSFFGLTIPQAVEKYLDMVRRPQSLEELAEALLKGGMVTSAKDFPATIHAILRRNADGKIIKVGNGWALASWYNKKPRVRKPVGKTTRGGRRGRPREAKGEGRDDTTKADGGRPEVLKLRAPRAISENMKRDATR